MLSSRELQDRDRDEERAKRRHDHVAGPVRQIQNPVVDRHTFLPSVHIIAVTSFQSADTVRSPSVAPTIGISGLRVTKFQIAPMIARPAAIGKMVPAMQFQRLSSTFAVANCPPLL